jgi:hypothetical protein
LLCSSSQQVINRLQLFKRRLLNFCRYIHMKLHLAAARLVFAGTA